MDSKHARQEAVNCMKQGLIMDAALKIVARDGYFAAKLEDIAEEAGFSKASLYHYFPDKEALFLSLMIREHKSACESCKEIVERDLPFLETVREIIYVTAKRVTANAKMAGIASGESSSHLMMSAFANMLTKHETLLKDVQKSKLEFGNLLLGLVDKAKQRGAITTSLDSNTASIFIRSIIHMFIMDVYESSQDGARDYNLDKTIDGILELLNPWINKTPELVSAERVVNRA